MHIWVLAHPPTPTSPRSARRARFAYPVHARRVPGGSRCCIIKPLLLLNRLETLGLGATHLVCLPTCNHFPTQHRCARVLWLPLLLRAGLREEDDTLSPNPFLLGVARFPKQDTCKSHTCPF